MTIQCKYKYNYKVKILLSIFFKNLDCSFFNVSDYRVHYGMHGAMLCLAIHQTSLSVDGRSGFFSKNFAAKYFSGSLSSSRSTFCKCANFSFKCFWEGVNNKSLGKLKKYSEKFQSVPDRCVTQKVIVSNGSRSEDQVCTRTRIVLAVQLRRNI